tara:strand:+ start:406 stop:603 length:198 start_codon:yes stop_codon:yes gene_type:complete
MGAPTYAYRGIPSRQGRDSDSGNWFYHRIPAPISDVINAIMDEISAASMDYSDTVGWNRIKRRTD